MLCDEAKYLDFNIHTTIQHNLKKSVPFKSSCSYTITYLNITCLALPRSNLKPQLRAKAVTNSCPLQIPRSRDVRDTIGQCNGYIITALLLAELLLCLSFSVARLNQKQFRLRRLPEIKFAVVAVGSITFTYILITEVPICERV